MEQNSANTKSNISNGQRAVFRVILTLFAAGVSVMLAYFNVPAMSVLFLSTVYLCCGGGYMAVSSALFAGGATALFYTGLYPDLTLLYDALYFIVVSFFTAKAFKKQRPYRRIVIGLTLAITLSIFIKGILPAIQDGVPAFSYIQKMLENATVESGLAPSMTPSGQLYLPYSILLGMTLAGLMTVLIYQAGTKLKFLSDSAPALKPMAPFHLWCLSKNFRTGLIVFAAAALIIMLSEIENSSVFLITMLVIAGIPLMIQGACLIMYASRIGCFMTASSWVIWIMLLVFFPSSLYILAFLGIVDQFSGFRSRFKSGTPPAGQDRT